MKHTKRLFAILLAFFMFFSIIPVTEANAATTWTINGKSFTYLSFQSKTATDCWQYAKDAYQYIWGTSFNNSRSENINYLKNLSISELTLTAAHVKEYVGNAALGSVIRVCDAGYLGDSDGYGHSCILVSKSSTGFTVITGGFAGTPTFTNEVTYTWSSFVTYMGFDYIKYIKCPYASGYSGTEKPSNPSVSVDKVQYKQGEGIVLNYSVMNAKKIHLYIDIQDTSTTAYTRKNVLSQEKTTSSSQGKVSGYFSFSTTAIGQYVAYINCINDNGSVNSAEIGFWIVGSKKADLGDSFDAYIVTQNGLHVYTTESDDGIHNLKIQASQNVKESKQIFRFTKQSSNGSYLIQSRYSGGYINCSSLKNGSQVYTTSSKQYFYLIKDSNGYSLVPVNNDFYCIDITDGKDAAGSNLQVFQRNTTKAQSFKIELYGHTSHTWNSGTVTKAATCAATGTKTYTCTVCGATKTETIAKTTTHTYNSGKVTKAATCAAAGTKTYTCTVCGATKTETIAKTTTHTYDSGKVTKAATCAATGVKTYTCSICKTTKTEVIAKAEHTAVTDIAVLATCTATGKTEGSHCSVCGTVLKAQTTVAATGHKWDGGKVTTEPTYEKAGVKTFTCSVCKQSKTESIAKLEKTYTPGDIDGDGKLSAADARLALRRSVGLEDYKEDSNEFLACDVDFDGKVSAADARLILRASVGLEEPKTWKKA